MLRNSRHDVLFYVSCFAFVIEITDLLPIESNGRAGMKTS